MLHIVILQDFSRISLELYFFLHVLPILTQTQLRKTCLKWVRPRIFRKSIVLRPFLCLTSALEADFCSNFTFITALEAVFEKKILKVHKGRNFSETMAV